MSEPKVVPTSIGGQAVIEGVMMRGKKMYAMAVRRPDNEIEMVENHFTPFSEKYPIFKFPILRGIVAFVDSLVMGMKLITKSAEIAGLDDMDDDEKKTKFDLFLENTFGDKLMDVLIFFSVLLSLVLTVVLFMFLPVWISHFALGIIGDRTWALGIIEGTVKIIIFIGYLLLVSRSKDIQRVFEYHGAEHKTINCFEHNQELTVENVRNYSRLHKRCGTSFLILVMLISFAVFIFVRSDVIWVRFLFRICLVPVIAGISYEVIKWAGRSDSAFVNIVSYPGMCLQHITTSEPDDGQMEVAIAAMKEVLSNE